MSVATVRPGVAAGRIEAPASKSYTHRALVAGHFAGHPFEVVRPLVADDTRATARGLRALGTAVEMAPGRWRLRPTRTTRSPRIVRCGNSGTTLRFLTAAAAAAGAPVQFQGGAQLSRRPIGGLAVSLRKAGVEVRLPRTGSLPMEVEGPIRAGILSVDGSVSSQYVSALLLALPSLGAPSELRVRGARVSEPYVSATVSVLRSLGIEILGGEGRWSIPAPQRTSRRRLRVPGDASSAAYLWGAAAVTGGRVTVRGIPPRMPLADAAILEVLRAAGAGVRSTSDGASVVGPVERPFSVDLTGSPDLYPLVGVLAAVIPGRSTIRGAAHVVFKESDRRAGTIDLARRLGARVRPRGGALEIEGVAHPQAVTLAGSDDHRIVMSAAVGALRADGPSRLADARAVRKSYPEFWSGLRSLGVQVSVGR